MRLILFFFLLGTAPFSVAAAISLVDLQRLDADSPLAPISAMRASLPDDATMKLSAMRQAALATGAQHGYAAHLGKLKSEIRAKSEALDNLYDFGALMRVASENDAELYMLPPVIQAAEDVTAVDASQRRIRVSGQLYVITQPARLVTRPPDWREYLVFDDPRPLSLPNKVLLPQTHEEQRYWAAWIAEGWKSGVIQADREMTARTRTLFNTYVGMVRYVRLKLEEKVDAPRMTSLERPVSGGGDELRIDDRVYELTVDAKMNPDSSRWRALSTDSRDSLLSSDEARAIDEAAKDHRREILGPDEDDYLTIFGSQEDK